MQEREPERLTELGLVGAIGMAEAANGSLVVAQPRSSADPQAILDAAKAAGLLAKDNQTDLKTGLYESDTGELLLDRLRGQLHVSTPKTEAVAFSTLREPVNLGSVRVEASDGNGLLSVSVIDGAESIAQSRRLLIIYATDARNTGMQFSDNEEKVIADFGRLPGPDPQGFRRSVVAAFKGRMAADAGHAERRRVRRRPVRSYPPPAFVFPTTRRPARRRSFFSKGTDTEAHQLRRPGASWPVRATYSV